MTLGSAKVNAALSFVSSPAQPVSVREDLLVQILHHAGVVLQSFKFKVRNLETR